LHKEEIVMRKQFWAVLALAVVALRPAFPQAQTPDVRTFNTPILQAQPCAEVVAGQPGFVALPTGIQSTANCIAGSAAGATGVTGVLAKPACRFIGSVLCIDPGADGKFTSFTFGGPADTTPVVQGIKLIKVVPKVDKCPDLWPGKTYVQTFTSGIRTFFPLKFTPCGTTFTLQIEIADVTTTVPKHPLRVRENRFIFQTTVRPETMEWVVEALHCEPLGVCEVPCITDEGLFQTLLTQSKALATSKGAGDVRALNTALDVMEATIVRNCMFQLTLFRIDPLTGVLDPCALFAGVGGLPGNSTISKLQFGIVDTIENPCCCKLISDIVCLKNQEIFGGPGPKAP
jgi:hypothetical protein